MQLRAPLARLQPLAFGSYTDPLTPPPFSLFLLPSCFCLSCSYRGNFVDLFVRVSNTLAITMYQKMGYAVYRRILGYYSSPGEEEDGFDMRKAMSRDPEKKSMVPLKKPVRPAELL